MAEAGALPPALLLGMGSGAAGVVRFQTTTDLERTHEGTGV